MKDFAPYQESLEMKELGFDEPCFAFYERNKELIIQECEVTDFHTSSLQCLAPTFSQAFRWFREKYCLQHEIIRAGSKHWLLTIIEIDKVTENSIFNGNRYELDDEIEPNTYEEAELACIIKLIEIVKKQNLKG